MKLKLILPLVIAGILFACNNNEAQEEIIGQEVAAAEGVEHEHQEEAIVLDNGQKWTVVPSMMVFIQAMENGVEDFSTKGNPTSEDYQELAILIDKNIRELTSNCTMEGQAHDELHKWLVPFIVLSENFDVAETIEEQEAIYIEFKEAYEVFNTFFE